MEKESKIRKAYDSLKKDNKRANKWKIAITVLNAVLVYVMVVYALVPKKLDIKVGETMPETIYATKKVEDKVSTDDVRARIEDQVPFQYSMSDKITKQQLEDFRKYYSNIVNARNYVYENRTADASGNLIVSAEVLARANADFGTSLNMDQINIILAESQDDFLGHFKKADGELVAALNKGIYESDVEKVRNEIVSSAPKDRTTVAALIDAGLKKTMAANMLYDEQATAAERQKAGENVETIYYSKGQVVAYKGETVTEAQFDVLNTLGFVGSGMNFDAKIMIGVALLIAVLYGFYYLYIFKFNPAVYGKFKYFTLSVSIITITMACCVAALNLKEYLMPIALAGLLTVALINRKVALLNNIIVCGLVAIIQRSSWDFYSVFIAIISTMVGIYVFDTKKTRFGIVFAGFVTAGAYFLTSAAYTLIAESLGDGIKFMSFLTGYKGVISIAVSTVLCLGITIVFEEFFNVLTNAKLVDLSGTENNLLKELIKKAPGTYHHSIMVANLSEAAAKAVGANALLARVASYYHDIGKISRPMYFKENQHGDINIHDSLNPVESARIITGHTVEGFRLGQKENLPREICDVILQHHGTTFAKFFYDKAIDLGMEINEEDFKYTGPKPQTKEAGIIMLADTLEAVMRLGYNEETSMDVIKRIVDGKIRDGQLDECDLSFKDVSKVMESFNETFKGMYHKRIAYKDDDKLLGKEVY